MYHHPAAPATRPVSQVSAQSKRGLDQNIREKVQQHHELYASQSDFYWVK